MFSSISSTSSVSQFNTKASPEYLIAGNPDVRFGLADNSRMPICILEQLAQDENPYVAHRASLTLSRLANISFSKAVA